MWGSPGVLRGPSRFRVPLRIPDPDLGEARAAHVQPAVGAALTADDIRDHVRTRLARYKVPRIVKFDAELPRDESGKLFERRLQQSDRAAAK